MLSKGEKIMGQYDDKIGVQPAVKEIVNALDARIDLVEAGALVDGSVTNAKLATDVKVGSLATLTTTSKASVVGAINEVNAKVAANQAASTASTVADLKTDFNALLTKLKAAGLMVADE